MEKEIIWSKSAIQEIYSHILKKSKSNITSNKLIDSIYNSVTILRLHSEIYEVDEMKVLNMEIIVPMKFIAIVFLIKLQQIQLKF